MGLFGLVVSTSNTPRASCAALSEFKALIHPLLDLAVQETAGHAFLRYASTNGAAIGDKLRDHVRYERARQLLPDPATKVTASELGYKDRSNFVRAFTRWSGQSPSQYRRASGAT